MHKNIKTREICNYIYERAHIHIKGWHERYAHDASGTRWGLERKNMKLELEIKNKVKSRELERKGKN